MILRQLIPDSMDHKAAMNTLYLRMQFIRVTKMCHFHCTFLIPLCGKRCNVSFWTCLPRTAHTSFYHSFAYNINSKFSWSQTFYIQLSLRAPHRLTAHKASTSDLISEF